MCIWNWNSQQQQQKTFIKGATSLIALPTDYTKWEFEKGFFDCPWMFCTQIRSDL